ncbi:MAG: hypothetical protein WC749_00740 [Dehalococcoidia bacterium]
MFSITTILSIIAILTGCALNAPASSNAGAVVTSTPAQALPGYLLLSPTLGDGACVGVTCEQMCFGSVKEGLVHGSATSNQA